MSRRLSICYAAPGHALLSTSGSARNILSLAAALGQWADVTVAFRSLHEPLTPEGFGLITIDAPEAEAPAATDDVAFRGLDPWAHLSYLRTLQRFAAERASSFDLVFEKGWRLSGVLLAAFRRHGVPGVLIENDVRHWGEPIGDLRTLIRYGLHGATQLVSGFASRRAPQVIAETEELRTMLVQRRGIAPDSLQVVGLGVDHAQFRPLPQSAARETLGIDPEAYVLLYVGGLDIHHDLAPAIEGLARAKPALVELHLVGDGASRPRYEALAARGQVTALPWPSRAPPHTGIHRGRRCLPGALFDRCFSRRPDRALDAQDPRIHGLCTSGDQCAERPHSPLGRGSPDRVPVRQQCLGVGRVSGGAAGARAARGDGDCRRGGGPTA
jgi:glycosyltransferase involved in cell wall biosynthesis